MQTLIERLYLAAAHAGFTLPCIWQPQDGSPSQTHHVGFAAPDESVLDGLISSTGYVMTYPATCFAGLALRDRVEIGGTAYQVREIRAVGDGSEIQVRLARLYSPVRNLENIF